MKDCVKEHGRRLCDIQSVEAANVIVHSTSACTRSADGVTVTSKPSGGQGTLPSLLCFRFNYVHRTKGVSYSGLLLLGVIVE